MHQKVEFSDSYARIMMIISPALTANEVREQTKIFFRVLLQPFKFQRHCQ